MVILKRFPTLSEVLAVYAIAVMILYGWTIYWFLWKLPRWIYYLTVSEIITSLAYALLVNLLESLVFIAAPLFLAVILPSKWFCDKFVATGGIFIILLGVFLIYFTGITSLLRAFSYSPIWQALSVIVFSPICAMLLGQIQLVERFVVGFADRAKIFLYLQIPLCLLSGLVVLFRNLL